MQFGAANRADWDVTREEPSWETMVPRARTVRTGVAGRGWCHQTHLPGPTCQPSGGLDEAVKGLRPDPSGG
jgi:hypothetical protein